MKLAQLAAASIAALIASSALAQMPPPASKDPAKVEAGTYAVEPNHTLVGFGVDHMGFTTFYGEFTGASGSLTLDPAKPAASTLNVTVPMASISTTNAKLDGELKSADWFDADKFATMTFKSTKVTSKGKDKAEILGDLTLHGVTKPVTLIAVLHGSGANPMSKKFTVGFDVTGKIKRSDFGITKYVPLIGDEVDLKISGAFEKQG